METSPRNKLNAPDVPAVADVWTPESCQHSRVDAPLAADIAVRLRVGVVTLLSWAKAGLKPRRDTIVAYMRVQNENLDIIFGL